MDCLLKFPLPHTLLSIEDLPRARLVDSEYTFSATGVDYFVPLVVKQGSSHVKRYGSAIIRLEIRAVHIKVSNTLY